MKIVKSAECSECKSEVTEIDVKTNKCEWCLVHTSKVRIYDNGGKTLDRYTVVYLYDIERGVGRNTLYGARGMCSNPMHPQGIGCYTTAMVGRHLGRRIKLGDLPPNAKNVVIYDLTQDKKNGGF